MNEKLEDTNMQVEMQGVSNIDTLQYISDLSHELEVICDSKNFDICAKYLRLAKLEANQRINRMIIDQLEKEVDQQ